MPDLYVCVERRDAGRGETDAVCPGDRELTDATTATMTAGRTGATEVGTAKTAEANDEVVVDSR
ncbi:MAG: hypothetical protein U5J64_12725 [Halobacteriales archaeon]|nr:hypothetical protein [Halobacteriales archaeon]